MGGSQVLITSKGWRKRREKGQAPAWETDVQEPVHPSCQHPKKPFPVLQILMDDMKGRRLAAPNVLGVPMPQGRCEAVVKRDGSRAAGLGWPAGMPGERKARREARGSGAVTRVVLAAKGGIHGPQ